MKSSLAFMGAVLVAFATGALLLSAIDRNDGAQLSHPGFLDRDRLAVGPSLSGVLVPGFAPDSSVVNRTSGVFVPNLGQVGHDVYFQLLQVDRVAHFRAGSILLQQRPAVTAGNPSGFAVNVRFVGANRRPEVRATGTAESKLSYVGGVAAGTFTATVPLFSEVLYSQLYDGVDLMIAASPEGVTRTFTLAPGTSVDQLLLHYEGVAKPSVSVEGGLHVNTPAWRLEYERPQAFQETEGERNPIAARFALGRFGVIGFDVDEYDSAKPLTIQIRGI